MKKVIVQTATKRYPVFIGTDIYKSLPGLIKKYSLPQRVFIVIDKKVEFFYGASIKKMLNAFTGKKNLLSLTTSERIKSFKTVQQIFSKLSEENFARDTLILAIGGGTIGDVAGFVASTYMRGVQLVHVPTTLLSAVDSSIGGKTAINFRSAKNLIGTFYQPSFVIVDTKFFMSLPQKELISGLGEVIKYSYLIDERFYSGLLSKYDMLLNRDLDYLRKVACECIKIKASVVSKDEKEIIGIRNILNFGHTFAHAFESNFAFQLSHGKAVMAGIISALFLSYKKGLINNQQLEQMIKLPLKFKSFIRLKNFDDKEIIRFMSYDKKSKEGMIKFVLIKNYGEILIDVKAEKREIQWALKNTKKILI
ncbi:MAG: 3-dehydroquinate synthase [Ignavibacteriaceae bacterium]